MNATREEKLQAAGWKVSTVNEFLGLTPEESALIETRLALSSLLRKQRSDAELSQEGLAEKIHSSQSRIAKAEKGDDGEPEAAAFEQAGDLAALVSGVARRGGDTIRSAESRR